MKKLTYQDFDQAYLLFKEAFVPAELRPYDKMKEMFKEGAFVIYGSFCEDELIGAIVVWEFDDFIYLENFAVKKTMRNHGLGGLMIQEIQKLYQDRLLVLEVEEPVDDLTKRRIAFYQRYQFLHNPYHFLQPALRENVEEVHLMMMSYPQALTFQAFEKIKKRLLRDVYLQRI